MTNPKLNMQIEFTNHCNLQCVECPHRMMKRKRQHMMPDVIEKVLEYIRLLSPNTVIMHKDGEPLLHPSFKEIFTSVVEAVPTTKIDIYTNGFFITLGLVEYLSAMAKENKVWLLVSFHRHSYDGSKYNLSTVLRNLTEAITLRSPNIEFVITTHKTDLVDEEEGQKWYQYWRKMQKEYPAIYDVHYNTLINHWGGRIKQGTLVHFNRCPYYREDHFFIGVTGNVLPCCIDLEEEIVFGNIMTDDFETIRTKRRKFYETLNRGGPQEDLCIRCMY